MGENDEQMMVRLALDGAGFMDGLRVAAAAEKKWGEQLTASLAAENKKRNELSIAAALERNQKINAIEEAARQQRIAKVIEEKEIMDGLVAEEAAAAKERTAILEAAAAERVAIAKAALEEEEAMAATARNVQVGNAGTVLAASAGADAMMAGEQARLEREGGWGKAIAGAGVTAGGFWIRGKFIKGAKTVEEAEKMAGEGANAAGVIDEASHTEAVAKGIARAGETAEEAAARMKVLAEGLKEVAEKGKTAVVGARAWTESAVLIREALRDNFSRMVGSTMILLQALWKPIAGVASFIEKIPVVNKLFVPVSAAFDAWNIGRAIQEGVKWHAAVAVRKESEKSLKESMEDQAEDLRGDVSGLGKLGRISSQDVKALLRLLKHPDYAKNQEVSRAIQPLMAAGTIEDQVAKQKELAEIAKLHAKQTQDELAAYRETLPLLTHRQSLEIERHELWVKMADLKKDSLEYAQAEVDAARLTKEINSENLLIAKEKKELQKKLSEDNEKVAIKNLALGAIGVSDAIPTIEELAGSEYSKSLAEAYGPAKYVGSGRNRRLVGGQFNLTAGDGPFTQAARNAELAKYQERWDIIHGNAEFTPQYDKKGNWIGDKLTGGAAFDDKQRRIANENMLRGAGLETPAMKAEKMNQDIGKIASDVAGILKAAATDGIKLDPNQ